MKSLYSLEITFLSFRKKPMINKIKFNEQIIDVAPDEIKNIEIPPKFFEADEAQRNSIILYKDETKINECIVNIFKGKNHFYCYVDEKGYTIELLFKKIEPVIKIPIYKDKYYNITKYDTNNTKDRKRFTILNCSNFSLKINDEFLSIPSIVSKIDSYQFSIYDIKEKLVISKLLTIENDMFYYYYGKYSSCLQEFKNYISNYANLAKTDIEKYLQKIMYLEDLTFFLNKRKAKLEKIFDNNSYLEFYINFSLFKVVNFHIENDSMKEILEYYNNKINAIKEDISLKIYQKILLIEFFSNLCCEYDSKSEIDNTNFTYYLMEKKENDSILDLIEKFFQEYRDKLNEDSPFFEKLIELDEGPGVYNDQYFYCFNMININELRNHLKEIETSIFVISNLKKKKRCAYTNINSGLININANSINKFEHLNFPLDKKLPKDKEEIGKIVATKIIYYLLHEKSHKKYGYENINTKSPTKYIENGKIYSLCNWNSPLRGENNIKIVPNKSIGEDGFFYEISYGKIGDYYIFELMDFLDDFSDLLTEVDLWVNNLNSLRDYIKYKYLLQMNNIDFKSTKTTINDKINDYKNHCYRIFKNDKEIEQIYLKPKGKKKRKELNYFKSILIDSDDEEDELKGFQTKEMGSNDSVGSKEEDIFQNLEESIKNGEEEEEEESNEEDSFEYDINKGKKYFMNLSSEDLINLKKTGILTDKQKKLIQKRLKYLENRIRYSSKFIKNT